jgi:hypothetical protein
MEMLVIVSIMHYSQTSYLIMMKNRKYKKRLEIQDTFSVSSTADGSAGARLPHPSVTEQVRGSGRVEVHPSSLVWFNTETS